VLDQLGRWIGTVQRIHLNQTSGRPEWVTVCAGRWVTTRHIAPLAGSTLARHGLQLPYARCAVHHAPNVMDADQMDLDDQFALYSHYLKFVGHAAELGHDDGDVRLIGRADLVGDLQGELVAPGDAGDPDDVSGGRPL